MLHKERKGKVIMKSSSINRKVKAIINRGMRPITRKINLKVYRHVLDFSPFREGNTQLTKEFLTDGVCKLKLYLHGNMIGCIRIDEKKHTREVTASDCGRASPTTVSRLNAFLHAAGYGFISACTIGEVTHFVSHGKGTCYKGMFDSSELEATLANF